MDTDTINRPETSNEILSPHAENAPAPSDLARHRARSPSMHEGVPDWHDCCACEAEPYWLALEDEEATDVIDCEDTGEPTTHLEDA